MISRRQLLAGLSLPAFAGASSEVAVLDRLEERAKSVLGAIRHPRTANEAQRSRTELRPKLKSSLGLERLPWPPKVSARSVGTLPRSGYRIEKLTWQSLPDVEVPAHLYLPERVASPAPAILFYCGHWWDDSKTKPDFQAFCINAARLGIVVLTFDPFGQGERGVSNRDHRRTEMLLAGVSQQGIAEYETQCALSYLLSRPEVDHARIGFTGASGGGYNTWITAALDDRISVAVPVVGTSEFYEQISVCRPLDWYNANEHCHFVPNLIRYANNHELLAMIAPRPLMIIAATQDQSFPITGVRQVYEYGHELYPAIGAEGKVAISEDSTTGHGYQQKKREAAYGWFLKWLLGRGDGGPFPEPATEPEPWDSAELRCFPPGRNKPAGPGISSMALKLVQEIPAPRVKPRLPELLGIPDTAKPQPLRLPSGSQNRLTLQAPDGLELPTLYMPPDGAQKGCILAIDDNGIQDLLSEPVLDEARRSGWAIARVDLRGMGELRTSKLGWVFAVSLLLGENFVWRQALDLLSVARSLPRAPLGLYARGHNASLAATYALYHALQTGLKVNWYVLRDGFLSFRQFADRPESVRASFTLHTGARYRNAAYDREIPMHYFAFDVLRHFDLPLLLQSVSCPGLFVNPIDGDWKRMLEPDAKRLLPSNISLCCEAGSDQVLEAFRGLLRTLPKGLN